MILATNQLQNIDEYNCKKCEVKLITCLYDKSIGEFLGFKLQLAHKILQRDAEESFFSYGYSDKKLKILYSAAKDRIPSAIISTCFKNHYHEIMNDRQHIEESSGLLFYLPSITDCKEVINQFCENVNLNPIDCSFELMRIFSPSKFEFQSHHLNSSEAELRN